MNKTTFSVWQNRMCMTYLLRLNQMKRFLEANNWEYIDDLYEADTVIIGACGAFLPDFKIYADKVKTIIKHNPQLIVYGCLPIIDNQFFNQYTPGKKTFIPARRPEKIEQLIQPPTISFNEISLNGQFRKEDYVHYTPNRRYILLQEGCNQGCYFCPHYLSIGRQKSYPLETILNQLKSGLEEGANEFVLEGNNGGSWGLDLSERKSYQDLIEAILNIGDSFDIHIGDFSPMWLKDYGECLVNNRIKDIKIPIQSSSSRLLNLLGRNSYVTEAAYILEKIKNQPHRPFLRTEIIIGLPTETEKELMETLNFVNQYFDKVSCFSFDLHPSTKIAKMKIPLLKDELIAERIKLAIDFFKDKSNIKAAFDNRGKICEMVTKESIHQ